MSTRSGGSLSGVPSACGVSNRISSRTTVDSPGPSDGTVTSASGFHGTFHEFTEFLRTDPRFYYDQPDDLVNGYRIIAKRIDPGLAHLFGKLPRLPYGVCPIPDFKALLAKRAGDPQMNEQAMRLYLARNPNSRFKSRDDIAKSPLLDEGYPLPKGDNFRKPLQIDMAKYGEFLKARDQLLINIMKVMADNDLDAMVHKTVEHQPTLIKDGVNPPYVNNKGIPTFNTFLQYCSVITVPAGFTSDNLPVGITFFSRPYSEPTLLKLAYAYEQATHHRAPPRTTPALAAR